MRNSKEMLENNFNGDDNWDDFWKSRQTSTYGKLVRWVRHHFVIPNLLRMVRENTEAGTLIEAGCGTAMISIELARQRGDDLILIDIAQEALKEALDNAREAGITVQPIQCDITQMSQKLERFPDGHAFNIGVVEHFHDRAPVLREMAAISGGSAFAVIPERSLFWRFYISLSFKLGLVPKDFYVHLFDAKDFVETVRAAGLEVLDTARVRVFGIIPYFGVRFRSVSQKSSDE